MESIEHQTDILANLDDKLKKTDISKFHKLEENKRNEGYRKKGNNVEVPREFEQNYKAVENEEKGKRMIIKVEKFERNDNIIPLFEHYESEQNSENQNMLVKLEHHCHKLENVSVSTFNQIQVEESKKNEGHNKIKVDEFCQNVEATQEFIQNYEADEYEGNGKGMIIKVEKFECSDDNLPQFTVEHVETEQKSENQNMLVKLEHHCDKLENVLVSTFDQIEESKNYERNKKIKADEFSQNVEVQESIQNYEADEYEENGKGMIIKVEKFECSDDNLPQFTVEHFETEQKSENQNMLVKLEHHCDKLENVLVSTFDQIEESKNYERHKKIKAGEFSQNVEEQESIQNYEAVEYEGNGRGMIIKVEKFECSDDNLPQFTVEHYETEQNSENQNMLAKLEHHCDKLENVLVSTFDQIEESKNYERHKKIKADEFSQNVEVQESIQNYEADEYEGNGKGMIIKVEKFECSDDNLPQFTVEHFETEQKSENQNMLVKLEHHCDKLENVLVSTFDQIEESKNYERHKKIKAGEFSQNVEVQESIQNYEADEYEGNGKGMIIKVEKFECSDDILPQFAVDYYEPEQNSENQNNVLFKSEQCCDKPSQTSQAILNEPEEYEENQRNKDSTAIVASAMYEVSGECNSSYSKHRRRAGNLSRKQNYKILNGIDEFESISDDYKDTISSELTQDDDSKSVKAGAKVLVSDSQCYVALEKLSYKCDICRYVTVMKEILVSHMKLHRKQSYSISECELKLKNQIISEKNEPKQLSEKPFACNVSSYKSAQKSNLNIYITHTGKKFACNMCSYKSTHKSCLDRHKLKHRGEMPFACNLCSYKCAKKSTLNVHKLKHTGEKPFACNVCSYKSARKSSLNVHKLKHTGEKPFACNMCSYKSTHKSCLDRHKLKHTGEMPFACNLCSYKGAQKSDIINHILTHTGEKPFACNMCSYKTTQKSGLNRHKQTHTGEKPFACNMCSYKTARKSSLKGHKLTHTGEKPFACSLCSYKSARKSYLNIHILTHTGEKPFACNMCSYKSTRKSSLNQHKNTHTGDKLFACNMCSYKTTYKSSLNKHKLKHTG